MIYNRLENWQGEKKMNTLRDRSKVSTAAFVLVLTIAAAFGALATSVPTADAQTTVRLVPYFYPMIGVNSPTLISWEPSPNVFYSPPYEVPPWTPTMMWPDANVTFTRPDGSTDVVEGPFEVYWLSYDTSVGAPAHLSLVYTPDTKGIWNVTFYWPGDGTYDAVTQTDSFLVGDHFPRRTSFAMLSFRPYPAVGLGQSLLVNAWVTPPPVTKRDNYRGYIFTIRRPDGTIDYTFTMDSECPGVCWWQFMFDTLGDWTVTFEFPGDHTTAPCDVTRTITVQDEWIPYPVEDTSLPTEPWTFPINVFNREWRNIAGSWFQSNYNASGGGWNPYTKAPRSAHVLWKLPPVSGLGGFIGSPYPISTSGIYSSSGARITTVMAGRGYYTAAGQIHCVDMSTGEELWSVPGSFNFGSVVGPVGPFGSTYSPTLLSIGTRFIKYDGLTGAVIANMTGLPPIPPPPPEVLARIGGMAYAYVGTTFFVDPYFYQAVSGWYDDTLGDWTDGYVIKYDTNTGRIVWNASFPAGPLTSSYSTIHAGLLISRCFKAGTTIVQYLKALNLTTGTIEYETPIMDKSDPSTWVYRQGPAIGGGYGLVYFAGTAYGDGPMVYFAFNASTGKLAWIFRPPEEYYPWGNFFAYMPQTCAYDMIHVLTYNGAFGVNRTTGEMVWHYSAGDAGMETPYNTWPFGSTGGVIGGGVIFAPVTEHSPTLYYRGTALHAFDAFTGEGIWSILGYYTPTAIAYGTLLASEVPSGVTYAFGKGPTATTVSSSSKVITNGSTVLIEGTVLDMSSAQKGTAAISDASMSDWMEYLHMQQSLPLDATGVQVTLAVVDPNGNYVNIGTATSNTDGKYALSWTPELIGTYQIVATFEGSESYYPSHATTYITVEPAPPAPQEPTEPVEPTPALSIVELAIIVAVIIVAIIAISAIVLVRKRRK
jgi:hypothetical protein